MKLSTDIDLFLYFDESVAGIDTSRRVLIELEKRVRVEPNSRNQLCFDTARRRPPVFSFFLFCFKVKRENEKEASKREKDEKGEKEKRDGTVRREKNCESKEDSFAKGRKRGIDLSDRKAKETQKVLSSLPIESQELQIQAFQSFVSRKRLHAVSSRYHGTINSERRGTFVVYLPTKNIPYVLETFDENFWITFEISFLRSYTYDI